MEITPIKYIEEMISRGMTEGDIAYLADIQTSTVNRIKSGRIKNPKLTTLNKLLKVYSRNQKGENSE